MQDLCPNISSGSTPPRNEFKNEGIPYLKVYNIRNQKIDFKYKSQFVNNEYHLTKLKRSVLHPGDIVMNIVGPPLGKTAIIPDSFDEWNCNQAIVFFKPLVREINQWIYTFLLSEDYLKRIVLVGSAGQDNISVTKSKNIEIPLPPIEEQKEIANILNKSLAMCNVLEEEIMVSKANTEKLMQSILIKLLGKENNVLVGNNSTKKETKKTLRKIKYNSKTVNMKLVDILKVNGKLHAEDLWKMSEHYNEANEGESIDQFYAELKKQIEHEKKIKESSDKGYLELI